jgi:hypothetical protein
MKKADVLAWEEVELMALAAELPYPAGGMHAVCHGDEKDAHAMIAALRSTVYFGTLLFRDPDKPLRTPRGHKRARPTL